MIGINIVFDRHYLEAALVTANEIHLTAPSDWAIQLTYLYNDAPNSGISQLICQYGSAIKEAREIVIIGINSRSIAAINRFHFNNSVIFKALSPIFCRFDICITIDAGFIAGDLVDQVYDDWLTGALKVTESTNTILFAYCNKSRDSLCDDLKDLPHTQNYPIGWVLGFNRDKYISTNLASVLMSNYNISRSRLVWPEQDLLCISMTDDQLIPLDRINLIDTHSLPRCNPCNLITAIGTMRNDFGLSKVVGSLKPWHRWVLNPKKIRYLKARSRLESIINLESNDFITDSRNYCSYTELANSFLIEYERHLIQQP